MAAHALRWHYHPRVCPHRPGLHWHWRRPLCHVTEHPSVGGMTVTTEHTNQPGVLLRVEGEMLQAKKRGRGAVDKVFTG